MTEMNWKRLLSTDRLCTETRSEQVPVRTAYQRDADRILFCNSFRRLQGKTQVYPLPDDDHVHTRLTHSLEVASVGRSIGNLVGEGLMALHPELEELVSFRDFGDCVHAACLAHDLGNPPFGHSGEDAIRAWFQKWVQQDPGALALTAEQREDLCRFEGNAQGFRIITNKTFGGRVGGLQLTYATLGAFTKYPRGAQLEHRSVCRTEPGAPPVQIPGRSEDGAYRAICDRRATPPGALRGVHGDAERKLFGALSDATYKGKSAAKLGIYQSEMSYFKGTARALGLLPRPELTNAWCRHPLAFLVEAADDICYLILDFEDGHRIGYVPHEIFVDLLQPIASRDASFKPGPRPPRKTREERRSFGGVLRALAVNELVGQVAEAFLAHETEILRGAFDRQLTHVIPSRENLDAIEQESIFSCYRARDVLQTEIAGFEVIARLLDKLIPAAMNPDRIDSKQLRRLFSWLGKGESTYQQLLLITDYVSGMTDSFAVDLYRKLYGLSLPGRRG